MTHPAPKSEPDVAGARERLLDCSQTSRHWSSGVLTNDLRLILSAYDRQDDLIALLIQNVKCEFAARERAEDENERQAEENERLRGLLDGIVACEDDAKKTTLDGLIDCIDNKRTIYQSKQLADLIARALAPGGEK